MPGRCSVFFWGELCGGAGVRVNGATGLCELCIIRNDLTLNVPGRL